MFELVKFKIYQQSVYGKIIEDTINVGGDFGELMFGTRLITENEFEVYYEQVCEAECRFKEVRALTEDEKIKNILEKIFTHFNVLEAAQDKNRILRSLSVLDIVEIKNKKYQVMGIGYQELPF